MECGLVCFVTGMELYDISTVAVVAFLIFLKLRTFFCVFFPAEDNEAPVSYRMGSGLDLKVCNGFQTLTSLDTLYQH